VEQEKIRVIQIQMTEVHQYFQLSHQQVAEVVVTMVETVKTVVQAVEEEILTSQEAQVTHHQFHHLKVIMVVLLQQVHQRLLVAEVQLQQVVQLQVHQMVVQEVTLLHLVLQVLQ
jgi:hypothetical protein